MNLSTLPTLVSWLRSPKPTDLVEVTFTGNPAAVVDLARAMSTVAAVTSMRHHVQADDVVRLEATCHRPGRRKA